MVAPLFLIIVLLAARAGGSEDLRDMGGIAFRAPVLAALFMIVTLATLAMPGSANFVGEFLILLGVFDSKLAVAIVASTGVVLASVYALRFYIRAMHNRQGAAVTSFEMSLRDGLVIVPLVLAIVAFALFPQRAIDAGEPAVQASSQAVTGGRGDAQGAGHRLGGAVTARRARRRRLHRAARRAAAFRVRAPPRGAGAGAGHAAVTPGSASGSGASTPRWSSGRWRSTT